MSSADLVDSEWWNRVVRFAGVGVWRFDENFNTTYVNPPMPEMLGYSSKEMMGENLLLFVPEDWKNVMIEHLKRTGRGVSEFLRKNGSRISVLISSDPVLDADGNFEGGTVMVIDVTTQRGTEDMLEASRNTLETVLNAVSDSLYTIDREGRISKLMNRLKELLESNSSISSIQEKERIVDELRLHTEHLKELVEERIQELLKAERLAAIGQTAAMIAHDLRNPLQDIRLAQHLLRKRGPHEGKLLDQIDRNVAYADRVVDSLLIYSQGRPLNRQETNVNQLLRGCLRESAPPKHVKVVEKLRRLPSISVDRDQMKRVFKNLVLNAIQAMEGGGTLTLETRRVGNSVVISIRDTGEGISEIKRGLIWKPFYTSRSKGMGLGLAIVRRIVELHDGTIDVKSKLGKGSTFTLRMPMYTSGVTASSPLKMKKS